MWWWGIKVRAGDEVIDDVILGLAEGYGCEELTEIIVGN
jgi:hypothetical protein